VVESWFWVVVKVEVDDDDVVDDDDDELVDEDDDVVVVDDDVVDAEVVVGIIGSHVHTGHCTIR
jgi:hypothetical protein